MSPKPVMGVSPGARPDRRRRQRRHLGWPLRRAMDAAGRSVRSQRNAAKAASTSGEPSYCQYVSGVSGEVEALYCGFDGPRTVLQGSRPSTL